MHRPAFPLSARPRSMEQPGALRRCWQVLPPAGLWGPGTKSFLPQVLGWGALVWQERLKTPELPGLCLLPGDPEAAWHWVPVC